MKNNIILINLFAIFLISGVMIYTNRKYLSYILVWWLIINFIIYLLVLLKQNQE